MRRAVLGIVLVSLLALPVTSIAATRVTPGAKCSNLGKKSGQFVCKRVQGKLVWRLAPTSSALPKPSATPSASRTAIPAISASDLQSGLVRADYDGYYEDEFAWFARSKPTSVTSGYTELNVQTNAGDYFSIQWTGYFIPNESGIWSFTTISDDGSQLWLGEAAISAVPKQPGALSVPGIHGPVTISRTVRMEKGRLYPIRIQFGDKTNWAQMTLFVKAPSWRGDSANLTGLVWHSPVSSESASGIDAAYAKERMTSETAVFNAALPPLTPDSAFDSMERCQLQLPASALSSEVRRGFPRSEYRLSASGTLRGIVVFVEFSDIKGADDIAGRFQSYTSDFVRFYEAQSYGKLKIQMDVFPTYIPIPELSSKYGMQKHNGGNPWLYVQDALSASDPFIDYSPYDFVVVIPPAGTSEIVYGPAFPTSGDQLRTQEKVLHSATVAGSDSIRGSRGQWWWTAHEIGHLFGLEHQYSWSSITYEAQLFGIWDLMEAGDNAPELLAWHRFLIGWLGRDSVHCLDSSQHKGQTFVQELTPVEAQTPGIKSVMIRLNDAEALVIESRRSLGFDSISEMDEGVLVYRVNVANHDSAQEALIITQTPWPKGATVAGTLRAGESVSDSGVTVKVLANAATGDRIEVTIDK